MASTWNYMRVELVREDHLIVPTIGPGGMTRKAAHAEIQTVLEGIASQPHPQWPMFKQDVVAAWRRGAVDDTVVAAPFVWTIYEHPADEDPRRAARVWLDDFAAMMSADGLDAQVAQRPTLGKSRSTPENDTR